MKTKRIYPKNLAVYFNKETLKTKQRLEAVSRSTGLSLSKVSSLALSYGIAKLEERLIEPSQLIEPGKGKKKIKS